MDDLVIFSDSWEEHRQHVREILQTGRRDSQPTQASSNGAGNSWISLCHVVGKGVILVPRAKAQAIGNYVKPKTKRGLRAFLGTVSYYRKFMEGMAEHTAIFSSDVQSCTPQGGMVKQHGGRLFTDL